MEKFRGKAHVLELKHLSFNNQLIYISVVVSPGETVILLCSYFKWNYYCKVFKMRIYVNFFIAWDPIHLCLCELFKMILYNNWGVFVFICNNICISCPLNLPDYERDPIMRVQHFSFELLSHLMFHLWFCEVFLFYFVLTFVSTQRSFGYTDIKLLIAV